MSEDKKTWLNLVVYVVKYVISIFLQKRRNDEFKKTNLAIKNKFDEIDSGLAKKEEITEKSNAKELLDRLNKKF